MHASHIQVASSGRPYWGTVHLTLIKKDVRIVKKSQKHKWTWMRKHIAHFKPEKVLLFDPAVLKDQDIILGLKKKT